MYTDQKRIEFNYIELKSLNLDEEIEFNYIELQSLNLDEK